MKNTLTYLFFILIVTALCFGCGTKTNKIPDLKESFSRKDKKPFGTYIAYQQLEAMYYKNTIREKKQVFTKTWAEINDTAALYVCMTPALFVNEEEVAAMMEYVYAGNDLFISAGYIDVLLMKRVGCSEIYSETPYQHLFDSMQRTFTGSVAEPVSLYSYFYLPFRNYFYDMDSTTTRVLGLNKDKRPNSIVYFHGKGRLFLHCDPRAFSNYFLLKENNYKYLENAMAFTHDFPEHLYWDDYYNKLRNRRNNNEFSSLSEIMKHPPLAYAFWLSVLLLLLYILFGGKRVQRVIEQVKPNENTTVTFTETIGRLYLQKKDNKNIADKMITYFNEYIRNKYFLNTNLINEDFITTLSRKSAVPRDKVDSLYRTIVDAHSSTEMNDYQLLSLNEQIQNFYKKT